MSVVERVGVATVASDLSEHDHECARDRVASLGFVDPLGAAMVRLMAGHDSAAYERAVLLLSKRAAAKFKCATDMRFRLAKTAIKEATFPFCRTCNGARNILRGELTVVCPTCLGYGLHRFSDFERAKRLGLSLDAYRKGWAQRLDQTREVLDESMYKATRGLRRQLERN